MINVIEKIQEAREELKALEDMYKGMAAPEKSENADIISMKAFGIQPYVD